MKPEIIEALALELTRSKLTNTDALTINIKSADLWVQTYLESEKEVKASATKANPPAMKTIDLKGW